MSKRTKIWLLTLVALVVWAVLAWFLGRSLGGAHARWLLTGGLWTLGLVAAVAVLWYLWPDAGPAQQAPGRSRDDLDTLLDAAREKLRAAPAGTRRALADTATVIVFGPEGSAKTTAVMQSGLEPELLAGAVTADGVVAPTPTLNAWFARDTVFVEAGPAVLASPERWSLFARRMQPGRLNAALGRGAGQAPRQAVVCVSAETLQSADGGIAEARTLRERVAELSRVLGVRLPVYVLFTKADRIPFFADFVANLTPAEAADVLGATLPMVSAADAGLYADRESRRVGDAFERLFRGLAARRASLLAREHAAERRPGTYEFPREFRKLAAPATAFLVELCRPSQLQASPMLRGFYFTGVRPVVVANAEPLAAAPAPQAQRPLRSDATAAFVAPRPGGAAAAPAGVPNAGTRRVPRWTYLDRFFSDVVLGDTAAAAVTRGGTRVSAVRRAAAAAAIAAAVVYMLGAAVSFANNRALAADAAAAARVAAAAPVPVGNELPSLGALQALDSLRGVAARLSAYARDGAPLGLRWGLYSGNALRTPVRTAYFAALDRQGLGAVRRGMVASLGALPAAPTDAAGFGGAYDRLKAYLVTTSEWARSTVPFLSPVMQREWLAGRSIDADRAPLLKRQLDFYAAELPDGNPYPGSPEAPVVQRARTFLNGFAGDERIYQFLLTDAAAGLPSVSWARLSPAGAQVVRDDYEVPAAFTKRGWGKVRGALDNLERYLGGERWVVGDATGPAPDVPALRATMRARYAADYVRHWREFVRHAHVAPYAGAADAAKKLGAMSGASSPLLQLFAVASRNTAIDLPEVSRAFQPVQAVSPPKDTTKLLVEANQDYAKALAALQISVDAAATAPPGQKDAASQGIAGASSAAKGAARALAQGFTPDPDGKIEESSLGILLEPITGADGLVRGLGAGDLNAAGAGLCGTMRPLLAKYPFNPRATQDATADEVRDMFHPQNGALWAVFNASMSKLLVRQGTQFIPVPGASQVSPAFLRFLNRSAAISAALFPEGATEPKMALSLGAPKMPTEVSAIWLTVDGSPLRFAKGTTETAQLQWSARTSRSASLAAQVGPTSLMMQEQNGPWALFKLLRDADGWQPVSGGYRLSWGNRTGAQQTRLASGPLQVELELRLNGAPPIMRPDYFAGYGCVSTVAQ